MVNHNAVNKKINKNFSSVFDVENQTLIYSCVSQEFHYSMCPREVKT